MEWAELDSDARDPAMLVLLLVPLGLINLTGRRDGDAISFLERGLERIAGPADLILGILLVAVLLWALGRIQATEIAWRGSIALVIIEGMLWGAILGPILFALTLALPMSPAPLTLVDVRQTLAVASGAGLYEEVVFRGVLFGGMSLLLRGLFLGVGWGKASRPLAMAIALILSSAAFAWAHEFAGGDPDAIDPQILTFRFLAGLALGGLFQWRGLAVVAWAHASYDAILLLG
jgi:membrane protease YdiL (CAAX protease family)